MDKKMKARAAALGIIGQSITLELAAKWGVLMSPGQRSGQSKPPRLGGQPGPASPSSKALPTGEQLPDKAGLLDGNKNEKWLEENPGKQLLNREPGTSTKKGPVR